MRVIAVLDLLRGEVVRGIAGRRAEYRPVESCLTRETSPAAVATALRAQLDLQSAYIADLDAITGGQPGWEHYQAIAAAGLELMVDAGLSDLERTRTLLRCLDRLTPPGSLVAGLETVSSPALLSEMLALTGPERLVFSLDLQDGVPLTKSADWKHSDAQAILQIALGVGVRRFILLDLARVGVGAGVGTEPLCLYLRKQAPEVEIIAGGGVRNAADLQALAAAGCDGVLVASALHDGRLSRADLVAWR